jgi:DNA-binding Lrp family transcriptional regulator
MRREKIETPKSEPVLTYQKPFAFDERDRRILAQLDMNARSSLAELSKKSGLSRDAVRNRIAKMVGANVIMAFRPLYNPPAMGFPIVNYVFIALYNPSEENEKAFIAYLKASKRVTYVASLIGKWDYILDIMAENQGEFDRALKEIRRKFPDLIKDYEVYGVLNEYKYEEIGRLVHD